MKAALLYENKKELIIENIEEPKIVEGEAIVKVKACGICHTDLNIIDGIIKPPRYPHILGHEIAGDVVECKPAAQQERELMKLIESDYSGRVIVYFYITCGRCRFCLRGDDNLCNFFRRIGFEEWGGYAEYVKVPIKNLIPLSKKLDYNAAILVDAGATTYRALRKINPKPGNSIAIIGVGGLGSMALQLAKIFGLTVLALDIYDSKLEYAKKLGADYTLNLSEFKTKTENISSIVKDLMNGDDGVDAVIDTVGISETLNIAMAILKRCGVIVILGYGKEKTLSLPIIKTIYEEYRIEGSRAATKWEVVEVLNLASSGMIHPLVTREYRLDEVNKALNDLRRGEILGRAILKLF